MAKRDRRTPKRRSTRGRNVLLVVLGLVAIGALAFFLTREEEGTDSVSRPEPGFNVAEAFVGGPDELLYVDYDDAKDLHRIDLETDEDDSFGEVPSAGDTDAARGTEWLSVAEVKEVDGGFKPHVYLFDPTTDREVELGVATQPLWSPSGRQLALLRPADPESCGEERCPGPVSVVVVDPETGDESKILGPGPYELLGWGGDDHLIVQEEENKDAPTAFSLSMEGDEQGLALLPKEFWGVSPDGRSLVRTGDMGTILYEFEDGRMVGEGTPIPIREGTLLGAGAFSHDSSLIAAMTIGDGNALQMSTIAVEDLEVTPVTEGGESSSTNVYWAPDNDAFVFTRFNGAELEAVYCTLDGECEAELSWTRGISLLRIE